MAKKDKIAVFGGTFNPPHNGHVHLLNSFRRQFGFDKVLIIPAAVPPHKQAKELATGEQRLEMCRLAFPDCEVCDYEVRRGGKNYTADTLDYLKGVYPGAQLYFIMGTDMFLSFASWRDPERIVKNAVLLCEKRDDSISVQALRLFAKEQLGLKKNQFVIGEVSPYEMSSTQVRSALKEGKSTAAFLPEKVEQYIKKEGLYVE